MRNILVICDRIPPEHSATGKIAFSIAQNLDKHNRVFLICLTSKRNECQDEGVTVESHIDRYGKYQEMIDAALNSRGLAKILKKINYHAYYHFAKRKGFSSVKSHKNQLEKQCKKIITNHDIDTILSVSNPFDCHELASRLVKDNLNIQWFAYMMDSNRNNAVSKGRKEEEIRVFQNAKKIFIMPALLNDHDFLEDFTGKISVLDLPIIPVKCKNTNFNNTNDIVFVYAGMFYKEIRSPEILFELFKELPPNYVLHLYSRGCDDIVQKYQAILGKRLQVHGFIETDELEKKISEANILVNIGNTVNNQVPSKVYESVAYGKPILNLYQREDDISIQHLRKYPVCINIAYQRETFDQLRDFIQWCEEVRNINLDYDEATRNLSEKRLENVVAKLEKDMNE